jgi:hypothetical protein
MVLALEKKLFRLMLKAIPFEMAFECFNYIDTSYNLYFL